MSESIGEQPDWERRLHAALPLFGHRNWIVVADAAYPMQANAGIETVLANADAVDVLRVVMNAIAASSHVRANIYLDEELRFVAEQDAVGVSDYRKQLDEILQEQSPSQLPHEQIIAKLDQAAKFFNVLMIKTPLTIPYTSVFFELDCGYWDAASEERLRGAIHAGHLQSSKR